MLFFLIFVIVLFVHVWFVEPRRLDIRQETVTVPAIETPIRILLITDIHLSRFWNAQTAIRQMDKLHNVEADCILLGGDFLDSNAKYLPELQKVLAFITAQHLPTYAVLGNHDYRSCPQIDRLIEVLEAAGVQVLINTMVQLELQGQRIALVGVNDLEEAPTYANGWHYQSSQRYQAAVRELDWYRRSTIDVKDPIILLTHNPDGVYLPGPAPAVVLAGHTHGGQLAPIDWLGRWLPILIYWFLPAGSFRTWSGRQPVEGRTLIVSRGVAGSAVPARLCRPPEVVLITLQKNSGAVGLKNN